MSTRTGSMGSRVPPAVTSTVRPCSGPSRGCEHREARRRRSSRARQPSRALVAAGEAARLGLDDDDAAAARAPRGSPVTLGVLPHLGVHRGADDDRRARREQRGGEQVVREAPSAYRASRSAVAGATTTTSAHWPRRVCGIGSCSSPKSEVLAGWAASAVKRERRDEGRRGLGEHGRDLAARVGQSAADLDGLVGGDAAGDPEDDAGCARSRRQPASGPRRGSRTGPSSTTSSDRLALGRPRRRAPRASGGGTWRGCSAISWNEIDSDLFETDVTCGGAMAPRCPGRGCCSTS